jgi:Tfp pilus assembly protein PilF
MAKTSSWSPRSINMVDLVKMFAGELELERLTLQRDFDRKNLRDREEDQTLTPVAECAIEVILRKRRSHGQDRLSPGNPADIHVVGARQEADANRVVPSATLNMAIEHHRAGNLQQAEQLYRQILQVDPYQVDALHLFGLTAAQMGKNDVAIEYIRKALRLKPDFAEAHSNLAVALRALGRLEEAETCLRQAVRLRPDQAEAHNNLGAALQEQGHLQEAEDCLRQALHLKHNYAEAHYNLGNVLQRVKRLDEAEARFREAVRLKQDYTQAHYNLGAVLQEQRRLREAEACFREAIRLQPKYAPAHNDLGVILHEQGRPQEAEACLREAIRLHPEYAEAHNNLAGTLQQQKRLEEAEDCLRNALRLRPDFPAARNNLGTILQAQGRPEEAERCLREVVRLNPEYSQAYDNLGNALRGQGRLEEAERCLREALRLNPEYPQAHNNLGTLLREQSRLEEAEACFHEAVRLKPDYAEAHMNLGMVSLLLGNFSAGWTEYEWRLQCKPHPGQALPQPLWDGAPLGGRTILLHADRGLGDTLQFIRYAPLVQQRGGNVVAACPRPLARLLRTCPGVGHLAVERSALPAFDVQAALGSLPGIFRTALTTIPAEVPYLFANGELVEQWNRELRSVQAFKVGIAWQGNPEHMDDRQRSISLSYFAPLASVEGVQLFSLQKGRGTEQLSALANRLPVTDLDERLHDFMDTAAVVKNLDLVITADTAVAHLAGALSVPVWMALPFSPDWRWLLGREDTPWYPTMRLFRQIERGNWEEVFQRITAALREMGAAPSSPGDQACAQ